MLLGVAMVVDIALLGGCYSFAKCFYGIAWWLLSGHLVLLGGCYGVAMVMLGGW